MQSTPRSPGPEGNGRSLSASSVIPTLADVDAEAQLQILEREYARFDAEINRSAVRDKSLRPKLQPRLDAMKRRIEELRERMRRIPGPPPIVKTPPPPPPPEDLEAKRARALAFLKALKRLCREEERARAAIEEEARRIEELLMDEYEDRRDAHERRKALRRAIRLRRAADDDLYRRLVKLFCDYDAADDVHVIPKIIAECNADRHLVYATVNAYLERRGAAVQIACDEAEYYPPAVDVYDPLEDPVIVALRDELVHALGLDAGHDTRLQETHDALIAQADAAAANAALRKVRLARLAAEIFAHAPAPSEQMHRVTFEVPVWVSDPPLETAASDPRGLLSPGGIARFVEPYLRDDDDPRHFTLIVDVQLSHRSWLLLWQWLLYESFMCAPPPPASRSPYAVATPHVAVVRASAVAGSATVEWDRVVECLRAAATHEFHLVLWALSFTPHQGLQQQTHADGDLSSDEAWVAPCVPMVHQPRPQMINSSSPQPLVAPPKAYWGVFLDEVDNFL